MLSADEADLGERATGRDRFPVDAVLRDQAIVVEREIGREATLEPLFEPLTMKRSMPGVMRACQRIQRSLPIGRLSVKSRGRADTEAVKRD